MATEMSPISRSVDFSPRNAFRMKFPTTEKQAERRSAVYALHRDTHRGNFAPDGKAVLNVEGDWRTPGGSGTAWCHQAEGFALGSMSEPHTAQNHACRVVYRHHEGDEPLGTARAATLTYLVHPPPGFRPQRTRRTYAAESGSKRRKIRPGTGWLSGIGNGDAPPLVFYRPSPDEQGEIGPSLMCSEHLPVDSPIE